MLKDILKVTNLIVDTIEKSEEKISSPIALYDMHRSLHAVINMISLVANHYLALNMTEEYLQNSSFGEPIDKWRYFLNKDLESLNISIKEYLHKTMHIGFEDAFESILSFKINQKSYYGFVQDEYNIGYIEPCSYILKVTYLDTSFDIENRYLAKYKNIELDTFEKRVELQKLFNNKNIKLKLAFNKLTTYIKTSFTLDELLPKVINVDDNE